MDPKELRGLYEAYSEVYAPQEEIEEAVKGESSERRQALAVERRAGHRPKSAKEGENYASHKIAQMAYAKRKRMGEEVEIFDLVLEFLQAEGYAETLEEAEWLMANVIDEEAIDIILGEAIGDVINTNTPYGKHRTVVTPTGTRSTLNGRDLPTQRQRDPKATVSPKRGSKEQPRVKKDSRYEEFEAWLDEAMSSYDKARKQAARRAEERNRLRAAGKLGGPMERISLRDKFGDETGTRMGKAKPPGPGEKY